MPNLFAVSEKAISGMGGAALSHVGNRRQGADEDEEMEEREASAEGGVQAAAAATAAAQDLTAAVLETLEALLVGLGPLLSPFIPRLLSFTTLQPMVLAASAPAVLTHARAVRGLLVEQFPMRLLLDPLVQSWHTATSAGPAPSVALLSLLSRAAAQMDRPTTNTYHGRIFDFLLLQTFDVRRAPPFPLALLNASVTNQTLPGHSVQAVSVADVEGAAVGAMVAVVLKSSESTFKPMFVRVLEWAASEYATDGDVITAAGRIDRHVALFGLINELCDRLRSVFVPYFQYLFDMAIRHLTGSDPSAAKAGLKKKRRKSASLSEENTIALWQLRYLVICSLHKCFVYDSNAAFLDAARFQAVLEPITSQIIREPPAGVAAILAPSLNREASLALTAPAKAADDMLLPYIAASVPSIVQMDDEIVACLGELAVAGGSDILWKQLNHQVLMCTRSEQVRARQLALRVVTELVERVQEEYVVLLPETIPFLAELLEDSDSAVAESAKVLVKKLEDLSGEDLTQYF
eukprot:TRINITY_DN26993_c0_g1_i1.p1 TRINITY_DN26993_c0_g1~~TRINITY_DN26993_c0_g1_i1.p1  ORF type:complete len:520 (+),score=54.57 TRINITY_DN26993_c0_g1_i1:3-1562(+)